MNILHYPPQSPRLFEKNNDVIREKRLTIGAKHVLILKVLLEDFIFNCRLPKPISTSMFFKPTYRYAFQHCTIHKPQTNLFKRELFLWILGSRREKSIHASINFWKPKHEAGRSWQCNVKIWPIFLKHCFREIWK